MKVLTQFDDELASLWPKTSIPFYSFAWHKTWYEHFGKDEQLAVFGQNGGIVPLAIRDNTAHFTGGEEIADYLDTIGTVDWKYVTNVLRERGAKQLLLRNIPIGSPTLSQFPYEQEDTTPILMLPDSFDAYLSSLDRKKRHELRRKMRRFEEEHTNIALEERVDIDLLLTLMRNNPEKETFLTQPMQEFFRALPSITPVKQFVLQEHSGPVATVLAFDSDGSLLLYNSGYNLEGSGWYIKIKIVEWAILNHYASVNFLQGNERYKYDIGASDKFVYRIITRL